MHTSFIVAVVYLGAGGAPGGAGGDVETATISQVWLRGVVGEAVGDVVFYGDAALYDAGPGLGQPLEDFERGKCGLELFDGPLSEAGAGPYGPGEINPGLTIQTTQSPTGPLLSWPWESGASNCGVLPYNFPDGLTIFAGGGNAIGAVLYSTQSQGACQVDILDADAQTVIGSTTAACSPQGNFLGAERTNGGIGGLRISALDCQDAGVDDVRHGTPEPGTFVLMLGGAAALLRRRGSTTRP